MRLIACGRRSNVHRRLSCGGPVVERLTERQLECLKLSATMTDKDIGRHLSISHHTVSLHIREAMRKLGASSRKVALRRLAYDPLYGSEVITPATGSLLDGAASGDFVGDAAQTTETSSWFLAPPPRRSARIGIILVFAAVAALVTVGIVSVVSGAVGTLAPHAPSSAILTQK